MKTTVAERYCSLPLRYVSMTTKVLSLILNVLGITVINGFLENRLQSQVKRCKLIWCSELIKRYYHYVLATTRVKEYC